MSNKLLILFFKNKNVCGTFFLYWLSYDELMAIETEAPPAEDG